MGEFPHHFQEYYYKFLFFTFCALPNRRAEFGLLFVWYAIWPVPSVVALRVCELLPLLFKDYFFFRFFIIIILILFFFFSFYFFSFLKNFGKHKIGSAEDGPVKMQDLVLVEHRIRYDLLGLERQSQPTTEHRWRGTSFDSILSILTSSVRSIHLSSSLRFLLLLHDPYLLLATSSLIVPGPVSRSDPFNSVLCLFCLTRTHHCPSVHFVFPLYTRE